MGKPLIAPLFIEHASPEAIRIELAKARQDLARAERRAERLSQLLAERLDQVEAGEWPPKREAVADV